MAVVSFFAAVAVVSVLELFFQSEGVVGDCGVPECGPAGLEQFHGFEKCGFCEVGVCCRSLR